MTIHHIMSMQFDEKSSFLVLFFGEKNNTMVNGGGAWWELQYTVGKLKFGEGTQYFG